MDPIPMVLDGKAIAHHYYFALEGRMIVQSRSLARMVRSMRSMSA